MKNLVIIVILFCFFFSYSQDYKKVDSLVKTYPTSFKNPKDLVEQIEKDLQNDYDKVRAAYSWIVNNINYDLNESGKFDFTYTTKKDLLKKDSIYRDKLSKRVISKNDAVCEGYSTLFKIICDNLGFRTKIVTGAAKASIEDIGNKFISDHAWNIVKIDGKSFLIDTTWGAGAFENGVFIKDVNYFYYMPNPSHFIKSHYPDNYENTLLKQKISKHVFLNYPLVYDYNINLIEPIRGIVYKRQGSRINFKIKTLKHPNKVSFLALNDFYDIENFNYENSILTFTVDIKTQSRMKGLTIYVNNEPLIGLKVK